MFLDGRMLQVAIDLTSVPEAFRDALQKALDADEHLQWIGHPDAFRAALANWPLVFVATIFVIGISGQMSSPTPGNFIEGVDNQAGYYIACAILVIAAIVALSPIWLFFRALRTIHIVTNKRIMTLTYWRRCRIASAWPETMFDVEMRVHDDGLATLEIDRGLRPDPEGGMRRISNYWYGLEDAVTAHAAITQMTRKRRREEFKHGWPLDAYNGEHAQDV
jgi:hypothetical protein